MIGEVEFLRKIQRILEEGDFVATYKYALLQSLADISIESEPDGKGELVVPLQRIGEYRRILRDHQQARCFYCHKPVRGEGVLDHFIPWVRYPIDLGHNFVFADGHCNASKRDHLAATDHLAHWREQNVDAGMILELRFEAARLHHDRERSLQICGWAYEQAELGESRVWVGGKHFTALDRDWRRLLAA